MSEEESGGRRFPTEKPDRISADFRTRIGFYIEDLTTGITHQHNEDPRFAPQASQLDITDSARDLAKMFTASNQSYHYQIAVRRPYS